MPQIRIYLDTVDGHLQRDPPFCENVVKNAKLDSNSLEAWLIAAIDKGIEEADEGKLVSHDAVKILIASWTRE